MKCTSTLIALCCCLAIFAACKKSDNKTTNNNGNNNTPLTTRQLLVAGKWQEIANTYTVNYKGKDTTLDEYATMQDCEKDDFITFADDGTATLDENTNVCAGNNQTEKSAWVLLSNDTKLAMLDNNPDTADVVELTSAQMKLKMTGTNSSGMPLIQNITFKNIK